MKIAELKEIIAQRIAGINDKTFLSAINTILATKSESTVYITTPEQKLAIQEGREQIARGEFFTDEEVKKEMEEWLKEK
jgi:predicted transcriptional regulator